MRRLFTVAGRVQQLAFNPTGTRLIAYEGGWLREWELASGETLPIRRVMGWPIHMEFALRAHAAAHVGGINTPNICITRGLGSDQGPGNSGVQIIATLNVNCTIALSHDAKSLAMAAVQPGATTIQVLLVDGETKRNLRSLIQVFAMAFNSNDSLLASGGAGGFTVWDLGKGESIAVWSGPTIERILFAPEGGNVAVLTNEALHLRHSATGEAIYALETNSGKPFADFAFSPDGRTLATSVGSIVQFWDAATGQPRQEFNWGIGNIRALAFAPDGLTAAAGSDRGQIVLWDLDA
jgi:WD40 repeat protein